MVHPSKLLLRQILPDLPRGTILHSPGLELVVNGCIAKIKYVFSPDKQGKKYTLRKV